MPIRTSSNVTRLDQSEKSSLGSLRIAQEPRPLRATRRSRSGRTSPGRSGKRLAVYVAVCLEHFSYGEGGLGLPYSPGIPHPNTYNWAWREYGNRVGGWRLLALLEQHGIPPTVLLNTECYEHCPQLVDAYRAAGTEFVAHGRTNSMHPNELDEDAERELIRDVFDDDFARDEGVPPAGWMSPGANPSAVTEDLLADDRLSLHARLADGRPAGMAANARRAAAQHPVPARGERRADGRPSPRHGRRVRRMMVDNLDEMVEQSEHAAARLWHHRSTASSSASRSGCGGFRDAVELI